MSKNWSFVTCITNLGWIHKKLSKLWHPQGQIIDINAKNRNTSAILNFFSQLLSNLSENLLQVAYIANLCSFHVIVPQVQIIYVNCEKSR